ncbi:MAG: phage tail sheath subtilisin-like domain-containing protein [Pseudomonadota bacterium]|nr:phage tail sheath subtilisin-like domain-containing protein [Pseudomonadota bacterium]
MPEYLSPGVYVEEVSFRSKTIEGVPTSTTGFAGMTRFGPVQYPGGPTTTTPRLVTSFTEFERVYGGLEPLKVPTQADERTCFLAHAARAFFDNGGKRLYVSRVFFEGDPAVTNFGVALLAIPVSDIVATWTARWPGEYGNVLVESRIVRGGNVAVNDPLLGVQARSAKAGAVIEVLPSGTSIPPTNSPLDLTNLRVVQVDANTGQQTFLDSTGAATALNATDTVLICEMQVVVTVTPERVDVYDGLAGDPAQTRYIGKILQSDDPEDENAVVYLNYDPGGSGDSVPGFLPAKLMAALRGNVNPGLPARLTSGRDGGEASPDDLNGQEADLDNAAVKATGLAALGEIDDIAIVALPDAGTYDDDANRVLATSHLLSHAENLKYRIAVVDGPKNASLNEIREFRGKFDSKYGAIYHSWIEILDPLERPAQGAPPRRLLLPPSGFVTGIYARSDIERGVHKAPANEVVRGLTKFEININKARQDVLNPEGINALRFFEGRGNRVWGARTMSSDPEWKYVNVRRLFIFIEHSIDKGTQFAVFEPNNPKLWANIRQAVEDFLLVLWRDGALLGDKPEQAFFVRCDRTTMTQNDLDNGRLICLIGVAPTKPAEFVIFRIGQFTADVKI